VQAYVRVRNCLLGCRLHCTTRLRVTSFSTIRRHLPARENESKDDTDEQKHYADQTERLPTGSALFCGQECDCYAGDPGHLQG